MLGVVLMYVFVCKVASNHFSLIVTFNFSTVVGKLHGYLLFKMPWLFTKENDMGIYFVVYTYTIIVGRYPDILH